MVAGLWSWDFGLCSFRSNTQDRSPKTQDQRPTKDQRPKTKDQNTQSNRRPMIDSRNAPLSVVDPLIAGAIDNEVARQANGLELIASENFVSEAVLEAMGSVFTNKYAEGYPGKRYYGGCDCTDVVEQTAIDRAKELFGADHANVQPHSGAQANMAVYLAVLQPGD